MAKLTYDSDGRLLFTKEMREEYTILVPEMIPIHFELVEAFFKTQGYKMKVLKSRKQAEVTKVGQRYVHNDICYPAILVIGQMIDAVQSGEYDTNKIALMLSQTGGGCRDSNYLSLLRKALKKANLEHIPIISLSFPYIEKNPGFNISLVMAASLFAGMAYADALMWAFNRQVAYEIDSGDTQLKLDKWLDICKHQLQTTRFITRKKARKTLLTMLKDFDSIPTHAEKDKPRVGIVGEIYAKYSPLGNNSLEDFLMKENVEVVVGGAMEFVLAVIINRAYEIEMYGKNKWQRPIIISIYKYLKGYHNAIIDACKATENIPAPSDFDFTRNLIDGYVNKGNQMGEGWVLTAEMLELLHSGVNNIICVQPFACLANHITGRGLMKRLKEKNPTANVVAIDYDPGASQINQENRIKLMLANAKGELA